MVRMPVISFPVVKMRAVIGLWIVAAGWAAGTDINPTAEMIGVDFATVRTAGDHILIGEDAAWLRSVQKDGGTFSAAHGAWVAPAGLEVGQGRLIIKLNRSVIPSSDLALTLVYSDLPDADFVVQLLDDNDRIVALDLFSNIVSAGREAKTDTFIVSFLNHPTATQVILRRVRGEVRIHGFALTPVACEVPMVDCDENDLAVILGRKWQDDPELVREVTRLLGPQGHEVDWQKATVQRDVPLAEKNEIAHDALSKPGYPEYEPSPEPVTGNVLLSASGSALFFSGDCLRALNLYHPGAIGEIPGLLTSRDAFDIFYNGAAPAAIMSIPMSVAEREEFYRKYGYHPIEAPIALDAIQVVVNRDHPLSALTIPELDAIYGSELLAGETRLIRTWGDLGLEGEWKDRPIEAFGGTLPGGTARLFQSLVLQGGPYREDLRTKNRQEGYYYGVVLEPSRNPAAIGYSNLQHWHAHVKQIALARNSGEEAVTISAETVHSGAYPLSRHFYIYINAPSPDQMDPVIREFLRLLLSREGQEMVGSNRQIPLGVDEILDVRHRLQL